MSEMEAHKGKLVPMNLKGDTLEERAEDACRILGYKKSKYHDSWVECLDDEGYRTAHIRDNVIYEIKDTELEIGGFVEGTRNEDGSYDYYLNYYNDWIASFSEVLDEVIVKANKDKS